MKNFVLSLFALSLLLFIGFGISNNTYKETKEYPIESIRYYVEKEEHGVFTTKTDVKEYFEYVYFDLDGEYHKYNQYIEFAEISNESKIVEEKGWTIPNLYLTLEDYNNLIGK